jgi:hypothetical protein
MNQQGMQGSLAFAISGFHAPPIATFTFTAIIFLTIGLFPANWIGLLSGRWSHLYLKGYGAI